MLARVEPACCSMVTSTSPRSIEGVKSKPNPCQASNKAAASEPKPTRTTVARRRSAQPSSFRYPASSLANVRSKARAKPPEASSVFSSSLNRCAASIGVSEKER